ncbi:tetratricopeptide repeat protein [Acidocella sp.]|uniref:tetratricopeptide repeat protein n=1 Tax=Acidocella sp. TaxID=50710 RepID=UPI00260C6647|nr:tetratricopeptide repeat protein [Acidocella sp.]
MKRLFLSGRGATLAVCTLLSACADAGPSGAAIANGTNSAYGAYLAAHYASLRHDPGAAFAFYSAAYAAMPPSQDIAEQGFVNGVLAGAPDAGRFAQPLSGNPIAAMYEGNQAMAAGDYTRAVKLYQALPADDLMGLIKPLLVAWAQFGAGQEPAALAGLQAGFSDSSFGPVYQLNAALIADADGDRLRAGPLYAAVPTDQPNLRLAQILASWDARQGQASSAEAELQTLAQLHPDLEIALPALQETMSKPVITTARQGAAEAYLTLAGALNQPGQAVLREAFLRFALQLRPDLSAARLLLADTLAGGGGPNAQPSPAETRDALAVLAQIPAGDPLYGPATMQRAALLAANNQPAQGAALLQGLLPTAPNDPMLLNTLAETLRQAGQCGQAIPYYTQALSVLGAAPPEGAWTIYFDRGVCEDQTGNWPAAEADMKQALSLSPDQPYVINYLAYSWALHGENMAQAEAMLTRAVSLTPDDGAVVDSLGYVQLKEGQTAKALSTLIRAVELDPSDAEVNGHLGDAFWQAGLPLQADYQWQRALSLGPDDTLKAEIEAKIAAHFGGGQ